MNGQDALSALINRLKDRERTGDLGTDDEDTRRWVRSGLHIAIDDAKLLLNRLDEERQIRDWNCKPMQ